jgi:hypothetical protein
VPENEDISPEGRVRAVFRLLIVFIIVAGWSARTFSQQISADSMAFRSGLSEDAHAAQDVLCRFFELLHDNLYAEAAELYGGSYSFLLEGCCPGADPDDVVYLWHEGCGRCGLQCLEVREVVEWTTLPGGGFRFAVKFSTDDGGILVVGPCCGASAEEDPPDSIFHFNVGRRGETWKVETLPFYVP